ncbi:putative membrane protein [Acinetobacter sp. BIGb0102]|uniref:bestrophin family protein n=1 Tax=Acinetobacter sp. BIGb0102 TaxID=2485131 RepID=UPI000F4E6B50|nr:bestrophin family protein [Acinetobacter sp. BIGb0102]RPE28305.1 putative membrane protein [Acinetobacter sp. BIGb0102]
MFERDKKSIISLLFAWNETVLPQILPALILVVIISTGFSSLIYFNIIKISTFPTISFSIFGVILSIFLGFKNTACYDRWWEARKLWGLLIASSRHVLRETLLLPQSHRELVISYLILFTSTLRYRLRNIPLNRELLSKYSFLNESDITILLVQKNPPQFILEKIQHVLITALKDQAITDIIYNQINAHITDLGNVQAGCDRIKDAPLPYSYSVLLHRAVYCFCFILPFSLETALGIGTPLLVGLIAYLFLGLDALSTQLEEPFNLNINGLPLDKMVTNIEYELKRDLSN